MNWLNLFQDRTFGAVRSHEWRYFRNMNIKDKCEICGSKFFLELHHVFPFHIRPDLELDENNVVTVCRRHHYEFCHFLNWKKFNIDIKNHIEKINE